jgi:hypothetical protein
MAFVLDIPNGVWPLNRAVGRAYIREAVPIYTICVVCGVCRVAMRCVRMWMMDDIGPRPPSASAYCLLLAACNLQLTSHVIYLALDALPMFPIAEPQTAVAVFIPQLPPGRPPHAPPSRSPAS